MPIINSPKAAQAAIEIMTTAQNNVAILPLICDLCEYTRKTRHNAKEWALDFLSKTIDEARRNPNTDTADFILALLTLNLSRPNQSLEAEAAKLINQAYNSLKKGPPARRAGKISDKINALYIASSFCDYIPNFNNQLLADILSTLITPSSPLKDNLATHNGTLTLNEATRLQTVADQTLPFAS